MGSSPSQKQTTSSTSTTTPNAPEWLSKPMQNYAGAVGQFGAVDPNKFLTPATGNQQQAFARAGQGAGSLAEADLSAYMNPYQSNVIDATMNDWSRGNDMALNSLKAAAPSSAFGGSRYAVGQGQVLGENNRTLAGLLAGLNSANFEQAMGRAQQDITNRRTDTQMMSDQGAIERGINMENNPELMRANQLAMQGGMFGNIPVEAFVGQTNTGSATSTSKTPMTFDDYWKMISPGHRQMSYPQDVGSMMQGAGSMMAMSDERLKRDVEPMGDHNGLPWYTFRYEWDEPGTRRAGVMAQDLLRLGRGDAVHVHESGYLMVDYGAL